MMQPMAARTRITPWLHLSAGLIWVFIGLRRFDRLGFLDVYRMSGYRGRATHPADCILPCAAGLLFLIAAATGFLKSRQNRDGTPEPITTIFGPR